MAPYNMSCYIVKYENKNRLVYEDSFWGRWTINHKCPNVGCSTQLQGGPAKMRPTYIFDGNI